MQHQNSIHYPALLLDTSIVKKKSMSIPYIGLLYDIMHSDMEVPTFLKAIRPQDVE